MTLRSFFRYGAVGVVATLTHYALLVAAVEAAGLPAWVGSGIGAVAGAQVAYAGNRHWTFAYRGGVAASWLRFQGTAALGAALGMAIVAALVHAGLYYLLAQVVATGSAMLLTYLVNRHWTFRA